VGTSKELTADLEAARLDFIISLRASSAAESLTLETDDLYSERTVVVCGKDNADIPRTTCSLAQLAQSPWVLPKAGFHSRDLIDGLMASAGRPPIAPVIETNYFETSLSIVAATRYLALAPEFAARRFEKLKMVRIVPTRPALGSSPVMLQYWEGQRAHPAYTAFRNAVTRAARLVHRA
jgi:DNA-binding transcriptional LysR family regulator